MTTRSINDQVQIIRKATKKASSSKEAAIAFLRNAGIVGVKVITAEKSLNSKSAKEWQVSKESGKGKSIIGSAVKFGAVSKTSGDKKYSSKKDAVDDFRETESKYIKKSKSSSKK